MGDGGFYPGNGLVVGIIAHLVLNHVEVPPGDKGVARAAMPWSCTEEDLVAVLLNSKLYAPALHCNAFLISRQVVQTRCSYRFSEQLVVT